MWQCEDVCACCVDVDVPLVVAPPTGKQSLSRLAAFICGYSVSQIIISSTYSMSDLRDDLKMMYHKAGVKDEGVMFLFTDSQITNERFLVSGACAG